MRANALHFGETHNTVVQGRAALASAAQPERVPLTEDRAMRAAQAAPAAVAGPTSDELMALSKECQRMPGGLGMHYENYARAVLTRWGAAPTTQSAPQRAAHQENDVDEKLYDPDCAACEAHCNSAADEYFNARPQLDSGANRRIFYAGHRKAWIGRSTAEKVESEKDALLRQALEALEGFVNIANDSQGVAGYHLNGNTAEWDEFDEVGAASSAIAAIRKGETK